MTNLPKNSKAIIMLALCPGRCLLHHHSIEKDQTIFFQVTAGNAVTTPSTKEDRFACKNFNTSLPVSLQCYGTIHEILVIYSFMLLRALHVEIEKKNLNLQVTLLKQNGVGTPLVIFSIAYSQSSALHF